MKVLHVETGQYLYGGARQVAYLLQGLRTEGVESVLCAPRGSAIAGQAEQLGLACHTTDSAGDLDFKFFLQLRHIMKQVQPDLVHLHSRRGADVLGGLAARLCGLPCVLSRRVDNPEPRWWVSLKYRLYDQVVAISAGIQEVLLQEGLDEKKISCVPSAVDFERYQHPVDRAEFQQAYQLPENAVTIGMVAQLIHRKGHRYLLAIAPELLEQHPNLHILIFGQGGLEPELKQQVLEQGMHKNVHFVGFRDDLERWLGCLDLVVHPADIEGLGVALLQSAAAGVPVVASCTGGIPEVVRDQDNGLLVEPGDTVALQAAIEKLLHDPALRRQMGRAGRDIVREDFSLAQMIAGNLAVYRRVLDNKTKSGSKQAVS